MIEVKRFKDAAFYLQLHITATESRGKKKKDI